MGYFHDYYGVDGDFRRFYHFPHGFFDAFVFWEALVEVVAPDVGVYEYHFVFPFCFSVGSHIFLRFSGSRVGVPSLMQPSISVMNSSGETGGMMIMFSFSILSRAFPPMRSPTLSRISFGISTRPLQSMVTSSVVIFST